jgi:hypothetical protein
MTRVQIGLAILLAVAPAAPALARGGGGGACNVCGCRGGPGYRAPDGRCVGHRNISKVCGVPPTTRCKKESAAMPPAERPHRQHQTVPNPFS